jgi:hypothetical protein
MQGKGNGKLIVASLAIAMSLGTVAWAHGFPMGHGGPGGPFGPHPGFILERLIFPCRAGCEDTARTCFETTGSQAEACATEACASQITAAQTACQAGRASSACRTASSTLATCAEACLTDKESDVAACRSTLSSCLTTCGNS